MSKRYKTVKKFYDGNFWPKSWVKDAVVKEWITKGEYKEITGEEYKE